MMVAAGLGPTICQEGTTCVKGNGDMIHKTIGVTHFTKSLRCCYRFGLVQQHADPYCVRVM